MVLAVILHITDRVSITLFLIYNNKFLFKDKDEFNKIIKFYYEYAGIGKRVCFRYS